MAYNILGITPAHNSSACILSDGEIVYFLEEERLSKLKRDGNPFRVINDILSKYKIDAVVLAGVNYQSFPLIHTGKDLYYEMVRKKYPNIKFKYVGDNHHLSHSFSSFYNSGFTKALSIVIDGNGTRTKHSFKDKVFESDEIESIFIHEYPSKHTLYNSTQLCSSLETPHHIENYKFINTIGIGKSYEAISEHLGFDRSEGGKTMGLSSYGKPNSNIPTIFSKKFRNKDLFKYPPLKDQQQPILNTTLFQDIPPEDLAWKVQNDTQQLVGDYIEEAIKETGLKQVCCAGGYFLNCVTNYYLLKRFPDVEFYFEPIANDAGTAIGSAKLAWHSKTQDTTIRPFKSLYLGKQYSKEELLEGIKKYTNK